MYCSNCGKPVESPAQPCPACGHASHPPRKKTSPLVVVLIVCAAGLGMIFMCGIVSAIAIPNLLNAIDRGKQKRTMADIRSIALVVESYHEDHGSYPVADDADELLAGLGSASGPTLDGWQHELEIRSDVDGYEIRSPGKDGVRDDGAPRGATRNFNADIVLRDGEFVQWPEGARR